MPSKKIKEEKGNGQDHTVAVVLWEKQAQHAEKMEL